MSRAYQFPEDPRRPNPFGEPQPAAPTSDNPYATSVSESPLAANQRFYDAAPHRSGMALAIGATGVVFGALAVWMGFYCIPLGAFNLVLTVGATLFAHAQLKGMKVGAIDESGRGLAFFAFILGIIGTLLSLLSTVIPIAMAAYSMLQAV